MAEMYARGLSTPDIEDALRDATGERLLTRTDVSAVTESLWAEYLSFRDRKLDDFDVAYLVLDAIFVPLRRTGTGKNGVLVAWGILRDGRRVLLHLAMGSRESLENWLEFLRDMVRRGLRVPLSITTDGAPGRSPQWRRCGRRACASAAGPTRCATSSTRYPTRCGPRSRPYLASVREARNPTEG